MDTIDVARPELLKRVARFADLARCKGGFPDSDLPGCDRALLNVLGFDPPDEVAGDGDDSVMSPVGPNAADNSAIPVSEGFNLGFVECTPGNGVMSHHHDTNETFVVLSGRWRFTWNDSDDDYIDLDPLDTVSFPVGLSRRFTNLESDTGDVNQPSLLLVVVAGDQPRAFMKPEFLEEAKATGKYTPVADRIGQQAAAS